MSTRRDFIGGMASVAFVGCGFMRAAHAQPAGRRREVVVNGRRVKTVDATPTARFRKPWP